MRARSQDPRRVGLAVLLLTVAVGCGRERARPQAQADVDARGLRGRMLPAPVPKPDLVLTDQAGDPFDLRHETDGYLTLLFFGYTHCPDVCPIHMATLAAVMPTLPPRVRERIRVVFVTTDPARDTPEQLDTWLANFDPSFIGLTGDTATIYAAQRALFLPLPQIGPTDSTGAYEVGHAAAIVAFTPDNQAHVLYPFGIRQADWAHDLPKLLEMTWSE
jgi:protein SCO1/2